jgi:hypothetical protein
MRTKLMIATAAAAALLAGGAFAQASGSNYSQSAGDTAVNPPAAAAPAPAPAPAAGADVTAPAPAPAPAPDATVAPAAGAPTERPPAASVSGGTEVISNGPVPDTPENRAKYGKPMSNAGRMTKPAGN